MNLLGLPTAWSDEPGGTPPSDKLDGSNYLVASGNSLKLYSVDATSTDDLVAGFAALYTDGSDVSGTVELRTYPDNNLFDSFDFTNFGEFSFSLPGGLVTLEVVTDVGGGSSIQLSPPDNMIYAFDDVATTPGNTPVIVDVLENDFLNASKPTIDNIVMEIVSQPSSGTVIINPDGTHTYTPEPGFSGQVTYQYSIDVPESCDGAFNLWCDWLVVMTVSGTEPAIDDLPDGFDPEAAFVVAGDGFTVTYQWNSGDQNYPMIDSTGSVPDACYSGEVVTITQGELSFCRTVQCNCG